MYENTFRSAKNLLKSFSIELAKEDLSGKKLCLANTQSKCSSFTDHHFAISKSLYNFNFIHTTIVETKTLSCRFKNTLCQPFRKEEHSSSI